MMRRRTTVVSDITHCNNIVLGGGRLPTASWLLATTAVIFLLIASHVVGTDDTEECEYCIHSVYWTEIDLVLILTRASYRILDEVGIWFLRREQK